MIEAGMAHATGDDEAFDSFINRAPEQTHEQALASLIHSKSASEAKELIRALISSQDPRSIRLGRLRWCLFLLTTSFSESQLLY